jgi:Chaperone of endosialidase
MSTLKTINIIHPSGSTNNIVNDASGNITVGGTLAATIVRQKTATNAYNNYYTDGGTTTNSGFAGVFNSSGTRIAYLGFWDSNNIVNMTEAAYGITFGTNSSERMRIDTSGNLLVGTTTTGSARLAVVGSYISVGTSTYAAGSDNVKIANNSSNFSRSSTAATAQIYFENPNGTVGQIQTSGSATAYLTSSDYRLKEDIQPLQIGLSTVSQMRPVSYKWKVDGSIGHGFIAHELQALVPDAVSGEKDAVDEDGKPIHQGVDYSKIVVHLVAAIQEQQATITALTARVAALEAK